MIIMGEHAELPYTALRGGDGAKRCAQKEDNRGFRGVQPSTKRGAELGYLDQSSPDWGLRVNRSRLLVGLVLLGVVLRTLVFTSTPRLLSVGDSAEYVALARELAINGFRVPPTNSIYYPGTPWIYPPLALELLAALIRTLGYGGWSPFLVLTGVMVVFDSLTIIPVFLVADELFGRNTAVAAGLIFTAYPPDLYALSWSAYPQIVATFISAWILWLWVRRNPASSGLRTPICMGLLVGLVALVHDLTIFILLGVLFTYAFLGTIWGVTRRRHLSQHVKDAWISLAVGLPFFAYWYGPRLWWVEYASSGSTGAQSLVTSFNQFIQSFAIPVGVYYGYMVVYAVLLLVFAYSFTRNFSGRVLPLLCFGAVPLALMVYKSSDLTILERLPYYSLLVDTIFVARGLTYVIDAATGVLSTLTPSRRSLRAAALAILVVFTAFTALSSVSYSAAAHTYYARCDYCADGAVVLTQLGVYQWIQDNTPGDSVFAAAGHVGYYIAAYDGRPTIVYHPLYYLTQPAERSESLAAYTLVFEPDNNTALTLAYILEYNVSYVVAYNSYNVSVPDFYRPVYTDGVLTVYQVDIMGMGEA
jgi:hypothetical protein